MIDLHIHSTYSDGTDTVEEILKKAEKIGLSKISITDHDRCDAYKELKKMDVKKYYSGEIITGIEIKCAYKGRLIEVLGYNFDSEKMQEWIDEYYKDKQRGVIQTKYFNILYDVCKKIGLEMNPKEQIKWNPNNDWASVTIYNEFKSHKQNKFKLPEDLWEDFTVFSKKYCGDINNIFHIDKSKDYPSLDLAIQTIKQCGGIALMAHIFIYKWATNKEKFIEEIIKNYDVDGFECYHSKFKEEESKYIIDICNRNKFYMSGGSDYHGANKTEINLGTGMGNLCIDENIIKDWY